MSEMPKTPEIVEAPAASTTPAPPAAPATPEVHELAIPIPQTHNPQLNTEIEQWAAANNIPTPATSCAARSSSLRLLMPTSKSSLNHLPTKALPPLAGPFPSQRLLALLNYSNLGQS